MSAQDFALFDTPIGICAIAWSANGIAGLQLPEGDADALRRRARRRWPAPRENEPPASVKRTVERIHGLLSGEPADLQDIPLDLDGVPEFNGKVYEVARSIPPGRTLTYGEVASRLGAPPEKAREVGQALGRNPVAIIVPCHRVLAANGRMGGFSARGGAATKRRMLEIEGALGSGPLFEPMR